MTASPTARADIAVLGAGSWGTALAIQCSRAGRPARLWGRDPAHVDLLARDYGVIARFGGGDNAGHSIEVGETKLALHVVPSGVLVPGTRLLIGAGTVVSLRGLVNELATLEKLSRTLSLSAAEKSALARAQEAFKDDVIYFRMKNALRAHDAPAALSALRTLPRARPSLVHNWRAPLKYALLGIGLRCVPQLTLRISRQRSQS